MTASTDLVAERPSEPSVREDSVARRSWRGWRRLAQWLVVWGLLLVWRREVLTAPAYFEAAMGIFREAVYLLEHAYNYAALAREVPGQSGGAFCYLISVVPTFLALVLQFAPSYATAYVIFHVVWFGAAAANCVMLVALIEPRAGWRVAWLAATAWISTPLVNVNADLLGLETLTICALLCVLCFLERQLDWLALVASAAVFFVKSSLGLVTAVLAVYFIGDALANRPRWRLSLTKAGVASVVLMLEGALFWATGVHGRISSMEFFGSHLQALRMLCPDAGVMLVLLALATIVGGWATWRSRRREGAGALGALGQLWNDFPAPIVGLIVACAWLATVTWYLRVFVIYYFMIPLAAGYLLLASFWSRGRGPRRVAWFLGAVSLFNLTNLNGRWFPELPGLARHQGFLQRSREYLPDQQSHVAAMRALADLPRDVPIVAPRPFIDYLLSPQLGYTSESRPCYALNTFVDPRIKSVDAVLVELPVEVAVVVVENQYKFDALSGIPPYLEGQDTLVFADNMPPPLRIFRKRPIDEVNSPDGLLEWYLDRFYLAEDFPPSVGIPLNRADRLLSEGIGAAALKLIEQRLRQAPGDLPARLRLCELYIAAGRFEALAVQADLVLKHQQEQPETIASDDDRRRVRALGHYFAGLAASRTGRPEIAHERLEQALAEEPTLSDAELELGLLELHERHWDEAAIHFERTLAVNAKSAPAMNNLGAVRFQQGRVDEASGLFAAALEVDPNNAEAHNNLATVLSRQRRWEEALRHFEEALRLAPAYPQAQAGMREARTKLGLP